jgi:hypothetical protein
MAQAARPRFVHRHNAEGSYDSICTTCLATVATLEKEEQLDGHELDHVCDVLRLYQISEGLTPLLLRTR